MEVLIHRIEDFILSNDMDEEETDFQCLLDDISDEIEEHGIGIDGVTPILSLMERHPLIHFGVPGALVHFVESYYKNGYEELLIDSVKRCPTVHTVWMLNRLINGCEDKKSMEYIQILEFISNDKNINLIIRDRAKDFLHYHKG